MNYLDWILLLILAWGAWHGYRQGLINLAAGLMGYVVGFLVALNLAGPLATLVDRQWQLAERGGKWLAAYLPLPRLVLQQDFSVQSVQQMDSLVGGWPLPAAWKAGLLNSMLQSGERGMTLGEVLAGQLVLGAVKLLALILLFYASLWLVRRSGYILSRGIAFTPFGWPSRLLGSALGLSTHALYLSLFLGAVEWGLQRGFLDRLPLGVPLTRQLYGSQLAPPLLGMFYWLEGLVHNLF
ncbi:MAG: CvpA family protein [Thermoanaerobacteraceae bacterium]|uniref:CvpA family protein n=1 Tax=Thermanaeromonas sp. C210 TaxID=2731925 RepID=UPI0015640380|nr:CvpA family protein [Thermanaeromonas sp. C210]MBE3580250.1 CvpA family protein [Thermoanaerobacteraceae bacterium]